MEALILLVVLGFIALLVYPHLRDKYYLANPQIHARAMLREDGVDPDLYFPKLERWARANPNQFAIQVMSYMNRKALHKDPRITARHLANAIVLIRTQPERFERMLDNYKVLLATNPDERDRLWFIIKDA